MRTKPGRSLWPGKAALLAGHCAGMADLAALPVWVGALVATYGFNPQQAGGLVTLFLAGAVGASIVCASFFHRVSGRTVAACGFAAASLFFYALASTSGFGSMALLHTLAGAAVGCAASATHGTIGRSVHPHRLFAAAGLALGVFALVFLGIVPALVEALGGRAVFVALSAVMAAAAMTALFLFPQPEVAAPTIAARARTMPREVWFVIVGISIMSLNQAMMFGFVERIGMDSSFGAPMVHGVLIALGLVNLLPAPLAAVLERRVNARTVLLAGPVLQAIIVLALTQDAGLVRYAVAAATCVFPMIFTHTFAFGMLARLDFSGRATAATPAMVMTGAALGPVIAGTLVKSFGYASLGISALIVATLAILCFSRLRAPDGRGTQPLQISP
jgi:predicted MFS family arabinose efflux permease